MKKLIIALLIVSMFTVGAFAQTLPVSMETRSALNPVNEVNPVIEGISSTTGLPIDPNRPYCPIITTIDNNQYALAHWGIKDADIMYEMPVQGQGWTRLLALFSDVYPEEAGPVRSARTMHLILNEEWGGAFCHFGQQEREGSSVKDLSRELGLKAKGLDFDGIGNAYAKYFVRVRYHSAPHNVSLFVNNLYNDKIVPLGHTYTPRPFLFTDEKPTNGTEVLSFTLNHKGNRDTEATYTYNADKNSYTRSTTAKGAYVDLKGDGTPIEYANVIVQRTELTFNNSSMAPLLPNLVGQGAADIFIGGKYIAGSWNRESLNSRTVFYDEQGNELLMQRGKSWICITDENSTISVH
ncbi:MAG: DUF3048 domain-containing protein [Eubacteriales bacterium]|nr:DUF3048 domain-containing protein [Eubacteriales bacterium]